MIDQLKEIEDQIWSGKLSLDPKEWNSLDVDYDPPRVERLWRQLGDTRVYIHMIHPCTEALYHPHPWPSAIKILRGSYEMGVGYGPGLAPPPMACKITLAAGSYYEMTDINGWHYVRPSELVLSLMITGPKWEREEIKSKNPLSPLSDKRKQELLNYFNLCLHQDI